MGWKSCEGGKEVWVGKHIFRYVLFLNQGSQTQQPAETRQRRGGWAVGTSCLKGHYVAPGKEKGTEGLEIRTV